MLWLICLCVFFIFYIEPWRIWEQDKLAKKITGIPLWTVLKSTTGNSEERATILMRLGKFALKCGGQLKLRLGKSFYVVLADPVEAEPVMKNSLEKHDIYKICQKVTGNGSLFAPLQFWRPRRKTMAPAFGPKMLSRFVDVFSRQSEILVQQLENKVGRGPFPAWTYIASYTMDSVCETNLGVKMGSQMSKANEFVSRFDEVAAIVANRITCLWKTPEFLFKLFPESRRFESNMNFLHTFTDEIIKKKRIEMEENQNKQGDDEEDNSTTFLESLIRNSPRWFDDIALREETLVMIVAGTDTSAVSLGFCLKMMSFYPLVQEKVYQEIKELFGDSEPISSVEDLSRLRYLDAVVKETIRLFPPAPIIFRSIDQDVLLPSGSTLPAGTSAAIHIWAVNRNKKYWGEDANEFYPERHIERKPVIPNAYLTFSFGPRNCIGGQYALLAVKSGISAIIRNYKIVPAKVKMEKMRLKNECLFKAQDNFSIEIEKRNK